MVLSLVGNSVCLSLELWWQAEIAQLAVSRDLQCELAGARRFGCLGRAAVLKQPATLAPHPARCWMPPHQRHWELGVLNTL